MTSYSVAQGLGAELRHAADLLVMDPRGARIGEALRHYVANAAAGVTIEGALGISVAPGGEPWWKTESRKELYAALCRAAAMIAPGAGVSASADRLRQAIVRYRSTQWHRDALLTEMPEQYVGHAEAELFAAFHAGAGCVPESSSRLRAILIAEKTAGVLIAKSPF